MIFCKTTISNVSEPGSKKQTNLSPRQFDRALARGRLVGLRRLGWIGECPYALTDPETRSAWMLGFSNGRNDAASDHSTTEGLPGSASELEAPEIEAGYISIVDRKMAEMGWLNGFKAGPGGKVCHYGDPEWVTDLQLAVKASHPIDGTGNK